VEGLEGVVLEVWWWKGGEGQHVPTDLLPTMAIFRCFCCGAMVRRGGEEERRVWRSRVRGGCRSRSSVDRSSK
jgi:hypothetical protein